MKTKRFAIIIAALAALTIIGAPSTAMASEEPIYLPAPTQNADGSITVPEVEGVFYGVYDYTGTAGTGWLADPADNYGWQAGDDIIVIASYEDWSAFGDDPIVAEDPSGVDSGGNPGWWFTNTSVVEVTAKAPTYTNPAGPNNLVVNVTETEAYYYSIRRFSNGKVQITAIAKPGYVLVGTTYWSKADTN